MSGGAIATAETAWLLVVGLAGLAVVVTLAGGWRLLRVPGFAADPDLLGDGAVLVLSEGVVQQASPQACRLLGDCTGRPVGHLLQRFLGPAAPSEIEAVARLEATGDPIDRLVRTQDGRAFELIGAPAGALIRLVLREARFLDEQLREAEARVRAAEDALASHSVQADALHALVDEGPIIAWRRDGDGNIGWCAGRIRTRTGAVAPEQAVELIAARTRLNQQPVLVGEPQKSRIEIVVGDATDTVSLQVVEIMRQDGSRIGFATDAGSAAAAERTLARFVQTMTETFAHLTVGLAIFDRNQTLVLFNPALVQMWQVEPAWLARRPSLRDILDELRAIRRLPELEDFHQWRAGLLGLFENTEAADYEELWHLADGSNIRVLARPHPHGALAFTFDDVTERMRLEQRYRHSIDLRRATLDGLTEGIAVFGANGLLQFVNQAFHEIWGTGTESVYAAMHARQLIDLCEEIAAAPDVWQKLHGFITGEESRRAWTAQLRTQTGRTLTARFAPLPDGSALAVFSDITRAERIAEALVERDAALEIADAAWATVDRLVAADSANVAGEIEAQAAAISRAPLPGPARAAADAILEAASRLRDSLAHAAAITARPLDLRAACGDEERLDVALELVAAIAGDAAFEAGVSVMVDPAGAPGRVSCPAAQLGRIALRLAEDAIARCQPGGMVVLRADGAEERFALHADIDAARRELPGVPCDRLEQLVATHGGRVEICRPLPGGGQRLSCRFEKDLPNSCEDGPLAGGAPAALGAAHPLKSRSG